ncbi:efflux RND transporter periplasmic adaptor subunit [Vibrio plantisponsor]|uniref:Efflux RND transporter periplasmic adaptor subunit n=1 Tax=Vibrio plantisponsor TaxID=664643 RepID=A0ABU4IK47_9VIBR|nr:efflux RND transporter periplasmic adaptor subunit [Vibrio plantisponsor]MDW6018942.1 efflux RND transporter periplasmic adaptor subunit [Vibrio plantisponsor]NNM41225.1 efflux RND transporter periplasmic adaptor subunit [Vibrio plantisponsor]
MSHVSLRSLLGGRHFTQKPWLVSFILIILLTLWLSLGSLNAQEQAPEKSADTIPLAKVMYQTFHAEPTEKKIDLYGRTAPDKQARLSAEIAGKILLTKIDKGDKVSKGQVIALIDQGDLQSQLDRAKAVLSVKRQEFKAAESLKNRGLQGEIAYTNALAELTDAKSSVKTVEMHLAHTSIVAPFDGVVENLFIEQGDFVGVGDPVATLIDLNKLVIEANVSERHIQSITKGQPATIHFIQGSQTQGTVRYLSQLSSPSTNTFAIEVEVPNPNQQIPAGVSTQVELNLETQMAVKITPAMLALDDQGNLGVKTLVEDRVHFVPIQLVKAEQDGVWLTGLGEEVNIITRGQGFVRDGDKVAAVKHTADIDTQPLQDSKP